MDPNLSPREQQVARLLSQGKQDKEIAAELGISVQAAKNDGREIRWKTGTQHRLGVALWWLAEGSKLYPAETE